MKVFMPNDTRSGETGGGSTFMRNLKSGVPDDVVFVDSLDSADLLFIAGPTLCDRDTALRAKAEGKPIILRLDNVVEDHRNRGTGIPRMKDFANLATIMVFQSQWAKHICAPITGDKGVVISNGVDTNIFHPREEAKQEDEPATFIYVKYSRNECKRFEEAQALFREYARAHKDARFIIVGRYADELVRYNMGFFNDEHIEYRGVLDPYALADAYREADVFLFPSFGDACPNVVLEAMATGLPVVYNGWGGTQELVENQGIRIDYNDMESPRKILEHAVRMARNGDEWGVNTRKRVEDHYSLEKMCEQYVGIFRLSTLDAGKVSTDI